MITSPCVSLRARGQRLVEARRGVDAFEPVVEQRLQAGIAQAQQVGQARQRPVRAGDRAPAAACRTPAWPAARRRAKARTVSSRPTSSALRRSRSAASSAVSQPGSMWMRRPQALQRRRGRAWPARACSLPSVCTFSCSAAAPRARADSSACLRASALTRLLLRAALARRARAPARCSSCSRASASRCASLGGGELRAAARPAARRRARRARLRSAAQPLAPRVELARLLVDVAAVGGQHLDLLLHLRRRRRAARCCAPAPRAAPLRARAAARACSSACAASSSACSSAAAICAASVLDLGLRVVLAARAHCAFCAFELGQALLDALAAFDHVADALLEPARPRAPASASAPCAACSSSLGRVVRLAHGLELGLDVAQLGHARFERVDRLGDRLALTRSSSLAASRCFRNQSWCCFSVPSSCSAR